jgi:hypothetical protein
MVKSSRIFCSLVAAVVVCAVGPTCTNTTDRAPVRGAPDAQEGTMKIRIHIEGTPVTATLFDNATASAPP